MGNAESAHHFKRMYDRVSTLAKIGVWEYDLLRKQLIWTDTVYDIFGVTRGTPIDREIALRFYEKNSLREMERLRTEAIASGRGFSLDIQIKRVSGETRWVRLTALVEQEAGTSVRIFGTKQDITSEKAAHEQVQFLQTELIHLSRASAIGAMTSTIAHELNQPLTALNGYLSAARRMAPNENVSTDFSECIHGALEASRRASSIVRSARAVTAGSDSRRRNIELSRVVEEALRVATAGVPHLEVSCDINPAFVVFADPIQIQQVLINLIRNACEAAAGGACRIRVIAEQTASNVEVCVIDEGPGIPADIIGAIFEAFTSTKPKGLGIGLSISRTIVEAHGGKIRAENLPDGGASVCFTLPKSSEHGVR